MDTVTASKKNFFTATNLKYIAIVAMLIDHLAMVFVDSATPLSTIMRSIGRITGPLLFFLAVESYHHTRNFKKYLSRVFIFFLVSYVPYLFFQRMELPNSSNWYHFNVMFTICLGLLAVRIRNKISNPFLKIVLIVLTLILSIFGDWGYRCIVMMLIFDFFYGNRKNQIIGYCAFIILDNDLIPFLLDPFLILLYKEDPPSMDIRYIVSKLALFLPAIFMYLYNGKKGNNSTFSKWFFYIFYPLHLLILGLINYFMII